jgi:hypothetical protein
MTVQMSKLEERRRERVVRSGLSLAAWAGWPRMLARRRVGRIGESRRVTGHSTSASGSYALSCTVVLSPINQNVAPGAPPRIVSQARAKAQSCDIIRGSGRPLRNSDPHQTAGPVGPARVVNSLGSAAYFRQNCSQPVSCRGRMRSCVSDFPLAFSPQITHSTCAGCGRA